MHEVVYPFMRPRFVFEVIRRMFVGEFPHVAGGERGVGIVIYYVAYALYAYEFTPLCCMLVIYGDRKPVIEPH